MESCLLLRRQDNIFRIAKQHLILALELVYCRVKLSLLQISPPITHPERESLLPLAVALPL